MSENPYSYFSVDAGHLMDFGTGLTNNTSVTTDLGKSMQNVAKPQMGACGLPQSTFARWQYVAQLDELSGFMRDLAMGYASLGSGAIGIAGNYVMGDVSASNGLETVTDAFYPPTGTKTLAQVEADAQARAKADQTKYQVPGAHLPGYDGSAPAASTPVQGSQNAGNQAAADATNHEQTYGNVENGYGGYTQTQLQAVRDKYGANSDDVPQWLKDYWADPLHYSGDATEPLPSTD